MRPNWFLGFPIDGTFLLDLPALPKNFRRFHEADVHMTLAFLGGCGEDAAMRALSALDERLSREPMHSMDVSLGEVVAMGSPRRYTALSALLDRGREEAAACITAYRDVLTETASGRRDERPAKPHVTVARPRRRATDTDRKAGLEWARTIDLSAVTARLDRVALYTWSEKRVDQMFRVVEERRLESGR
jgi:2'-5' RNA ligase